MSGMQIYDNFELIEPIKIEVEQIRKEETIYADPITGRRETINNTVRTPVTLNTQLVFGNSEQDSHRTQLGMDEEATGYCIFLKKDIDNLEHPFERGDRIVAIVNQDGSRYELKQKLYFLHSVGDLFGHFSTTGIGYVRVDFKDRDPVG